MKSFRYRFPFLLAFCALPLLAQPKPKIESDSRLPDARVNTPYITTLSVRGGTAPYAWDVVDGSLPQGMILIGLTGTVGGIPTSAGDFKVTIRVTDAANNQDSQAFRLTVISSEPGPSIDTTSLPAGVVGTAYSANFTASSGTPPYTWLISAGALPSGISLDGSSGALSGTPTTAGNADFTARVSDSTNQSATKQFRITVNPAAPCPRPSQRRR